ncbi:WecB/TagA/CpsF family glycosyltransferase [Algicella marina]|uniref:WecB/TagA/CpsF family glycosyltransferase n=1 Tax=Algicella marina TaxID=2683284 RepID=A0A6P1T626_9RHOB|nr:WecB/TagA/CpsF family glycosyltransferase [Algicella marina]QHQ37261.1 WecB/TagA/CpsF family glycosyltransferase [Algicella marina]
MDFRFDSQLITVNMPDRAALMAEVASRFQRREGFALATINLDHLVKLRASPVFAEAYARQDLVCADGNPIVWLSKLAGKPVTLMPGSDLVLPLARLAAESDMPLALVGSTEEALAGAKDDLEAKVPGLRVAYAKAPPMGFEPGGPEAEAILRELDASGARLCFIALGAPKQEIFAAFGRTIAPSVGFASVGAGVDFLSGHQQRAPLWVRRIAMEWVWRMLSSPRRLVPRYARCLAILPGELIAAMRQRAATSG